MKASYKKLLLQFKQPSGTSRGVLTWKETYLLTIEHNGYKAIGECALLRGLSADDSPQYEEKLQWACQHITLGEEQLLKDLIDFPSICFGLEQAFHTLKQNQGWVLFPSEFTAGKECIPINGLIWMGTPQFMKEQIKEKLKQGFRCIKMKIGAIDFQEEWNILKKLRSEFSVNDLEIRVDANGAFSENGVLEILEKLATLQLHSIEQPIGVGQVELMAELCRISPLPIALDEELIGIHKIADKQKLIREIKPQYIILKPSLVGGWKSSEQWIQLAEKQGVGWWVTSALESNIGLNAIAQWTYTLKNPMPQGLGTGGLYTNNLTSPLFMKNGCLYFQQKD